MLEELRKIYAFLVRDLKIMFTYKLALSATFLQALFNLFYLILFGSMFGSRYLAILAPYGGDFISYILIGSIGWGFMWSIMESVVTLIRMEMEVGTLESILLTPTSIYTISIAYTISGTIFGFLSMVIILLVGYFIFDINILSNVNIFTVIVLVLSGVLMAGFGMLLGGLTIWTKQIGDITPLLQGVTMFFSGVYFPTSLLPHPFQAIANFIPFYYSIEGLRQSLNCGKISYDLIQTLLIIASFATIFVVLGLYTLRVGLMRAKKEGTIVFY